MWHRWLLFLNSKRTWIIVIYNSQPYLSWCTGQPQLWGCHGSQISHEHGSSGWTWFRIVQDLEMKRQPRDISIMLLNRTSRQTLILCTITYWLQTSSQNSESAKTWMLNDTLTAGCNLIFLKLEFGDRGISHPTDSQIKHIYQPCTPRRPTDVGWPGWQRYWPQRGVAYAAK